MVTLARLVIAAPASGQGKTTLTIGLMAALRERGVVVAPAKVGPDYIDPGYHELACGRRGRNLDPFLVGEDRIVPLLLHGAATPVPADVAVIEGVMGLFDGRLGTRGFASTAHVAALTGSPVLLCVDIRHTSRTIGALVHGLASYDPAVRIGGVVLNHAGSPRHAAEAAVAIEECDIPVLGVLPRLADIAAPSRHLGLVPVQERDESRAQLARLGTYVVDHVDVDRVLDLARTAPALDGRAWDPRVEVRSTSEPGGFGDEREVGEGGTALAPGRPVIALAAGRAFTFRYAETEELLTAAGCDVVEFDPLTDGALPAGTAGLYLGGGFPQVHAGELASNERLRTSIRTAVAAGLPTVAECAGLLYLCERLDDTDMVGALPLTAAMSPRLTLGYREATAPGDTLLTRAGEEVHGHEFHRTTTTALPAVGAGTGGDARVGLAPAWSLEAGQEGVSGDPAGTGSPTLHASYLHVHWAGHPHLARRFATAASSYAANSAHAQNAARTEYAADTDDTAGLRAPADAGDPVERIEVVDPVDLVDLAHHGDRDVVPGLVDLAVNVRPARTPDFLVRAAVSDADWASYPDARGVPELVAAHHGVPVDHVLLTSGAAEAFLLIAHALRPAEALVIHPQFTEPEAALHAAGHPVRRHILSAADGFVLDAAQVPRTADLVMLGNPTNPTSVLHPAAAIDRIRRDGPADRVVVVDEAFMDAVPGEPESMIRPDISDRPGMRGLIVLRSLTKTWGLAGLRAGYAVGDPALLALLARHQPPWAVSTPALRATAACMKRDAVALARHDATLIGPDRADLTARLTAIGARVVDPARAPFVLVDTSAWGPGSLLPALADRGFAVRRGETFPGLGRAWIRVAVRTPAVHTAFAAALDSIARPTEGP
jgi:cobyrinic acid a,c-diamide synthase